MANWLALTILAGILPPSLAAQEPPPPPPVSDCFTPGPWIVFFERNSAKLNHESKTILDLTLGSICENGRGHLPLLLTGHADGGERPGASARRLAAVRRYLITRGVPARDLSVKDYGSRQPRVPIKPGVPTIHNRRVELQVRIPSE